MSKVLEMLVDDNEDLYDDGDSDFEGEGVHGYLHQSGLNRFLELNPDEDEEDPLEADDEEDAEVPPSSALSGPVFECMDQTLGKYRLPKACHEVWQPTIEFFFFLFM